MSGSIIYPGTFDPITYGHIDLIERGSRLFSKVIVAISANNQKNTLFSLAQREELIRQVVAKYPNVEVCTFSGLLVDLVSDKKITMILRGLRAISDFEYELQLAGINRMMDPQIETVFLTPSEKYAYVSASMAREIASLGGDTSLLVPQVVSEALKKKF
ncbi:MAG: pantetheine-phosphate adenylyltransferase [Gammaproteobacteria bacterium]|nr:pantetheine-phosphate adenylyltransferase [Gammaproteobacteria bacterium]